MLSKQEVDAAFVNHIQIVRRPACAWQCVKASGKQYYCQVLTMCPDVARPMIMPLDVTRSRTWKPLYQPIQFLQPISACPVQAISPGIMGHGSDYLQYLIEAVVCLHEFNQIQTVARDRIMMVPHQQNELSSIRQLRRGFLQLLLCISVTSSFAGIVHQLSKQSQSINFAVQLTGHWAGRMFLLSICRLAKIIIHDIEDRQESIHINHK